MMRQSGPVETVTAEMDVFWSFYRKVALRSRPAGNDQMGRISGHPQDAHAPHRK